MAINRLCNDSLLIFPYCICDQLMKLLFVYSCVPATFILANLLIFGHPVFIMAMIIELYFIIGAYVSLMYMKEDSFDCYLAPIFVPMTFFVWPLFLFMEMPEALAAGWKNLDRKLTNLFSKD